MKVSGGIEGVDGMVIVGRINHEIEVLSMELSVTRGRMPSCRIYFRCL